MAWLDYGGLVYKNNELLEECCNNYPWHVELELDGLGILVLKDSMPIFKVKGREINSFKDLNPKHSTFTGKPCMRVVVNGYMVWFFEGKSEIGSKTTEVRIKKDNDWWSCTSGFGIPTPEELKKSEWNDIIEEIEDDVMSSETY